MQTLKYDCETCGIELLHSRSLKICLCADCFVEAASGVISPLVCVDCCAKAREFVQISRVFLKL